jgi:formylglycine-generating enzyme required for sulfatase activity
MIYRLFDCERGKASEQELFNVAAEAAATCFHMSGNVGEWSWDWWGSIYPSAAADPQGPDTGSYRRLQLGNYDNSAICCVVDVRFDEAPPSLAWEVTGFRPARTEE